jgi:tripartite-type tricarboxylate transporter receptor subunit TctC
MRLTITLLCLTLGLAACSFSSSDPPPPHNTTIVVPAQPGTYQAPPAR